MADLQQKAVRGPVTLTGIHSSGRCMAAYEQKMVYLDFGIPGETVTFALNRKTQGFRSGQIIENHHPSPHRVDPFCIHFEQCGGCTWQHIDYPFQLELKHRILTNALKKYAIETPDIPPVIISPEIHYYRHRMEYTFTAAAGKDAGGPEKSLSGQSLGFHHYGEPGRIIDIRECFLQQEPSRAICDFVKSFSRQQGFEFYHPQEKRGFLRSLSIRITRSGEAMVVVGFAEDKPVQREILLRHLQAEFPAIESLCWTLHRSHSHSQLQGEIIPFASGKPYIYITLAGNRFRVHAASFFQPNIRQAEQIFVTAREWTGLSGNEIIYDLYTGVGTLALVLASKARQVIGVEGSPKAIEDALENAALNGIQNVTFLVGDILHTFTPDFISLHGKPDLIVLDPPRSGTLIEIKKTINGSGADKVLYLSCNPVSLAFDLKQLTEVYRVIRIQPFDMLPHTHHLETLVLLQRK